ncbi:MAG: competence/damage-inducible protein A [Firmicutes bacterium]|nr:competence/damage-inducible protein A [Bacillota bacterium]MCL5038878.1 competence/damage-inducible protein A [Bacillota bacterium]
MIVEILSVGTELLLGETINTNAAYLGQLLSENGFNVYHQVTVGDNEARLEAALRQALARADVIVVSGGLGPTEDDLTRETAARVLGVPLELDETILKEIEEFFRRRGSRMSENNRRQAMVPRGALAIHNRKGTAPGLIMREKERVLVLLPGPPFELRPMVEEVVLPHLHGLFPQGAVLVRRILKIGGMGESHVAERVGELFSLANPTVAPYAKPGEVHLRLAARAPDREKALALIAPVEQEIRHRLAKHIFGEDNATLEGVVGDLLRRNGLSLAVAESCTGGGVMARLTSVAGSSEYLLLGAVTYALATKVALLGIPEATALETGGVSPEVALAMAKGARRLSRASVGIATTGYAGPTGGTEEDPVGTVYLAVSGPRGEKVKRAWFAGNRQDIQARATQEMLTILWQYLAS